MHIKQVIIEGFKSYKEQITAEPFSPKINCVVGANGSGKSNFFHAVRFVISDVFSSLRAEERQQLLHEGAGHGAKQAYVEVVFDNSDGRFPIEKDEFRLRRVISANKDEYYLDKKHKTKAEVVNFLESAGFSRANPYYVVQQGKIIRMAAMKDNERLELLKEIGGTNIYEERRKDSLRIMQETEARRQQIEENVAFLEARLAELDSERKELAEYQTLDKARKSLEYTLYDKEYAESKANVDKIDEQRKKASEMCNKKKDEAADLRNKAKALEKEIKNLSQRHAELAQSRAELAERKTTALKLHAAAELDVQDLQDRIGRDEATSKQSSKELENIRRRVAENEAELESLRGRLTQCQGQERELDRSVKDKEHRLKDLYTKQGRNQQFNSVAERDESIRAEVAKLEKARAKKVENLKHQQQDIARLEEEQERLRQEAQRLSAEVAAMQQQLATAEAAASDKLKQRNARHDERKELWRKEDEVRSRLDDLKEEVKNRESVFQQSTPREVMKAMLAVKRITKEHNITGVHGILMELIDPQSETLYTAIEVVAGNSLFHMVVDDDTVSTRITNYLIKERSGRITFMPLNTLRHVDVQYPTQYGKDVVAMVKKIKHQPQYARAVEEIFNKALICRDMKVAQQVSADGQFMCVTLDGDLINRKGAMSGGYMDKSRSKIQSFRRMTEARAAVAACELELQGMAAALAEVDTNTARAASESDAARHEVEHLKFELDTKQQELARLEQPQNEARLALEHKMSRIGPMQLHMQDSIADLERNIASKQAELGTPLLSALSAEERAEVEALNPEIKALQEQLARAKAETAEWETKVNEIASLLSQHLLKKRKELEDLLGAVDVDGAQAALQQRTAEMEEAAEQCQTVTDQESKVASEADAVQKKLSETRSQRDRLRDEEEKGEAAAADEARAAEALMTRRSALLARGEDLARKIRDLGSLPTDAFEKYRNLSHKEIQKKLAETAKKLDKFSSVNRKALDQYMVFTEQREELRRRQAEVEASEKKIRELINTLDMRKDAAIERTFKQVAKEFRAVFAELVPGSTGELIMQRAPANGDNMDGDQAAGTSAGIQKYSGVVVRAHFGAGATTSMSRLSGGQKTLVALALIFAIQRCDPAPFYLFDEIDAALDPQYRTTVAKMLRKQADNSANAQFIITTFHPQVVMEADKIYGVSHTNRISRIDVITRDDALAFLATDEDQGKVAAAAAAADAEPAQEDGQMEHDG